MLLFLWKSLSAVDNIYLLEKLLESRFYAFLLFKIPRRQINRCKVDALKFENNAALLDSEIRLANILRGRCNFGVISSCDLGNAARRNDIISEYSDGVFSYFEVLILRTFQVSNIYYTCFGCSSEYQLHFLFLHYRTKFANLDARTNNY